MAGYCANTDLLLGDLEVAASVDKSVYVQEGADEIDMAIGHRYSTPVTITTPPLARHSVLLLKRINAFISTGRLILSLAISGEQSTLHSYGVRMLKEGLEWLAMVARGEVVLEGAALATGVDPLSETGPSIKNLDELSAVESFYNRVMRQDPYGTYVEPAAGSLVWGPGKVG